MVLTVRLGFLPKRVEVDHGRRRRARRPDVARQFKKLRYLVHLALSGLGPPLVVVRAKKDNFFTIAFGD